MDQAQFGNLGATLVDLGNKFATTESSIMEMSLRLAAAGLKYLQEESGEIAAELGTSTRPIFTYFESMEQVQLAVRQEAQRLYERRLEEAMTAGKYPPYKASGMAYMRFALEERELFRLLFMRDRSGEGKIDDRESVRPILNLLQEKLGLDEEQAARFHGEMWLFVHGIATALATGYLPWDEEQVSRMMSDVYFGLRHRFCQPEQP